MNLEKLMSMIGGKDEEEEMGGEHMEKMRKAYKLMKKATELIGECCEEGEYKEEDDEEEGMMPAATTFVIQKSKR